MAGAKTGPMVISCENIIRTKSKNNVSCIYCNERSKEKMLHGGGGIISYNKTDLKGVFGKGIKEIITYLDRDYDDDFITFMMGTRNSGPYHDLVDSINSTSYSNYISTLTGSSSIPFKNTGTKWVFDTVTENGYLEDFVNVYYGGDLNNFCKDCNSDLYSVALNNQWDGSFASVISEYYESWSQISQDVLNFLDAEYHSSLNDCIHDIVCMCFDSFLDVRHGGSFIISLNNNYKFDFNAYLANKHNGSFLEFIAYYYRNGCEYDNIYTKTIKTIISTFSFIKRKLFPIWLKKEILDKNDPLKTDIESLLVSNDFWVTTLSEYTDYYFSESMVIRYDADLVSLYTIMRDNNMLNGLYNWLGLSRESLYNGLMDIIVSDSVYYEDSSSYWRE